MRRWMPALTPLAPVVHTVCCLTCSIAHLQTSFVILPLNAPAPVLTQVRAAGIPVALLGFVATGVFRGFKDTRTPLAAAVVSAGMSLGLNVLCLKGGWAGRGRGAMP